LPALHDMYGITRDRRCSVFMVHPHESKPDVSAPLALKKVALDLPKVNETHVHIVCYSSANADSNRSLSC
jgi:hypothetical protein